MESTGLSRRQGGMIFAAALLALLLSALPRPFSWPTYWDGTLGPVTQAVWLHDNGFDYRALLLEQPGYGAGGPKVYLWSLYPPFLALVMKLTGSPGGFLAVMHALGYLMAAGFVVVMTGVMRRLQPRLPVWLPPLVILSQPFFLSQAAAVNMEIPVLLCGALALRAFARERWPDCALWLLAGLAVKASVVPLSIAISAAYLIGHARGVRHLGRAAALASPLLLGWTLGQIEYLYSLDPGGDGTALMTERLFAWQAWVGYNLSAFLRTPDLMLVSLLLLGAAAVRLARGFRGPRADLVLPVLVGAGLVLMLVFNLLMRIPLPRYVFSFFPVMLAGLAALTGRLPLRAALALPLLWTVVNLFNLHGQVPRALSSAVLDEGMAGEHTANDGYILERSLEMREDAELQLAVAAELQEKHAGRVIVTSWPLIHHLRRPWFGYVDLPLAVMSSHRPVMQWAGVQRYWTYQREHPDHGGRVPTDYVWVWTNNVFSRPLPPREHMEVLNTIRRGEREAVIFRYTGWPRDPQDQPRAP